MTNTGDRFNRLIQGGPKVRCSRTGWYYPYKDTVSDGKGGRVSKANDIYVHEPTVQQSKYKGGRTWQRGFF
jgi:hypothetical protein